MRWVGIDEAGYGPNLGPLVLAAVVAESPDDRPPDLWSDLPHVGRARSGADRLWIDDSKAIYKGGKGRERLEEATVAALVAAGRSIPSRLSELLRNLAAGSLADVELTPWLEADADPDFPGPRCADLLATSLARRPLESAAWRIVDVSAVVIGPRRFNEDLRLADSKAGAHFAGFARLLGPIWSSCMDGEAIRVRSDKHGGRHFYLGPLSNAFPDAWIDRGPEGPALSRYTLRGPGRELRPVAPAASRRRRRPRRARLDRGQDRPRSLDVRFQWVLGGSHPGFATDGRLSR